MKRHLNTKNKVFITLFVLIILVIIGILVYSVKLAGRKSNVIYTVTDNVILFADDYSSIDTTGGGKVEKNWKNEYQYISNDNVSIALGDSPVIYNSTIDEVVVAGTKYQVLNDGSVNESESLFSTSTNSAPYFFKLADRKYLIIYKEIYDENKTIYTKKYLIVDIDKQGNASLLNDVLNVKTINPIKLYFENYIFDVANERLFYKESVIDLKQIIGSTNEYVEKEKKEDEIQYDAKDLLDSYNELVNDFTKYAKNHNYAVSANNQVSGSTIIVNNNTTNNGATDDAENKTEIEKRVSLRGAVTTPSYIDVSYIVTDPENKYQAVYLLVTGVINNSQTTEKVVLDKYDTKYRIKGVNANSEYTISLGYIEIITKNDEKSLVDNVEDVINVRTKKIEYKLTVEKVAFGKVYFTYKMNSDYAFENADIALIIDNIEQESVPVNYTEMISSKGFSASFELLQGSVYELRVNNAKYNNKYVDVDIYTRFTLTN